MLTNRRKKAKITLIAEGDFVNFIIFRGKMGYEFLVEVLNCMKHLKTQSNQTKKRPRLKRDSNKAKRKAARSDYNARR